MLRRNATSILRRTARSAIHGFLPTRVRNRLAESLRGRHVPPLLRRALAPDGPFTVDVFDRPVRMVHTRRWIEDALFWDGAGRGYEPATLALWVRAAARSHCILDVGANTGLFALSAQAHQPAATVIAFEPVPAFCQALRDNAALNGFALAIRQVACSDHEGTATLLMPPALGGNVYAATLDRAHAIAHGPRELIEIAVDVRRLDLELARIGAGRPDLVKIDAEGVDAAVLRGLGELLAGTRTIVVEVQGERAAAELAPLLPEDRWQRFVLDDRAGPRRVHDIAQASGGNMLFVHPDEARALGL